MKDILQNAQKKYESYLTRRKAVAAIVFIMLLVAFEYWVLFG